MAQEFDAVESVRKKVAGIFTELADGTAGRLDGRVESETTDAIRTALTPEYGADKSWEIAFHMTDWRQDAAFVVALHLFPDRFTGAEIDAGIKMFLMHAPSHIRAACGLTGEGSWVDFYD